MTMQNPTDDSFNTTLASVSLPSPVATSGWNSSVSSDFGATSIVSPEPIPSGNTLEASACIPSYDSFDDPISGSRLPSLRSYCNSEDDNIPNSSALPQLNVAGSRRSIDFQSALQHPSMNLNDNSCVAYGSMKKITWSNNKNSFDQHSKQTPYASTSASSSTYSGITFSLPATCNNLKR